MTAPVPVIQADRKAAYDHAVAIGRIWPSDSYRQSFEQGDWDQTGDVQAFARHRQAETKRCAAVAEDTTIIGVLTPGWPDGAMSACRQIAAAIRSTAR